jgi:sodium-dependent dicarboxylate transporter 2/3/5
MLSRSVIGLLLGPFLFFLVLLLPIPEGFNEISMRVVAIALLMATFWITEAIPIAATSLLPIFLYPVMGVMSGSDTTLAYGNHLVFLLMGGFFIAVTVEKWQLHRRIALVTIRLVGDTANRIILGFMLATAFLSMWISNTASTLLMMTIGLAVISRTSQQVENLNGGIDTEKGHFRFGIALMLGIAYASSIGGISTLIGTAPNAIFAGVVERQFGQTILLLDWMKFAFPLSMLMLIITWFYLTRVIYPPEIDRIPGIQETLDQEAKDLGPVTREEKLIMAVFVLVALGWLLNGLLGGRGPDLIKDSTIAIGGALMLFIIPSNLNTREFLLDWKTAVTIPWDVLILFGGGFALAAGFSDSGLTHSVASLLIGLKGTSIVLIIAAIIGLIILLTELTSNTATASISLPIMIALAEALQIHPYSVMIGAVIAASFAFMLPVATPPNAIVFGSRYVTIPQMARAGAGLNIIGIILITLFVLLFLPFVWDLEISGHVLSTSLDGQ